jgi:hypothetical protein
LEVKFGEGTVSYRWQADEPKFAMPVQVGTKAHWETIRPTTAWKSMKTELKREEFEVATDLYYIEVRKLVAAYRVGTERSTKLHEATRNAD